MITYAQIEAIHEAMRELDHAIGEGYSDDVALCLFVARRLAKIRAALAGEVKPIGMSAEAIAAAAEIKRLLAGEVKEGE